MYLLLNLKTKEFLKNDKILNMHDNYIIYLEELLF